jgi:UDP-2,3-diacylglucosamine pyrophosphatase LpxH
MPDAIQLNELQVVSDLHLGGRSGFQIFASTAELVWLADSVAQSPTVGAAALLINGDFIDFLAEEPAAGFDAASAVAKIDRVLADPSFAPVFAAFARLLARPDRLLIVNLGNHDLELALPASRERLAQVLCGADAAARARLLLVTDGTGVRCRVGPASVLCLHGNETDAWNVTDFEHLRRLARDLHYGLPATPWMPNAGAQLVVEVMNQVKKSFPFVDLLKPETTAVLPILGALDPSLLGRLKDLAVIAGRTAADAARLATGFLGADAPAPPGAGQAAPGSDAAGWTPRNTASPAEAAQALLDQAEQAFRDGVEPISLVRGNQSDQLSLWSAALDLLRGKPRAEVLRQALEFLDADRSFDPGAPDDTFKQFDARVGPGIDLLLTGHTHLARSLARTRGVGHYFNSGTWARLMRIAPALRQDPVAFAKFFARLGGGPLADLESPDGPVLRTNTVVAVWADAAGATQAELREVRSNGSGGWRAVPQAGTRYAKPGTGAGLGA